MWVERLSQKALTTGILIALGLISVVLSLIMGNYFREAAQASHAKSLGRVMEVATQEAMRTLSDRLYGFGSLFQSRADLRAALVNYGSTHQSAALRTLLDDPLVNGFTGFNEIKVTNLRLYDAELGFLTESSVGAALPSGLPAFLRRRATGRVGVERLRAIGGVWLGPDGPLYSELVPIGGMRVLGYLEVVALPAYNLRDVARITRLPITVRDGADKTVAEYSGDQQVADLTLPIEYVLAAEDGAPAFRLIGTENVTQLHRELIYAQTLVTAGFMILYGAALWGGIRFFKRFVFDPLEAMECEMERCGEGDLSVSVQPHALKEFRRLATAFNHMANRLRQTLDELQRLSSQDGLTGVANRRHFDEFLALEYGRAVRNGEPLSLIMVDVDHFKKYNDLYGHVEGDECLRTVAALLREAATRPTDRVARYGGEEFALLLPATNAQGAAKVAQRIVDDLKARDLRHEGSDSGRLTASMGCATCIPRKDSQPVMLVELADRALYAAKRGGRNRFVVAETPAVVA